MTDQATRLAAIPVQWKQPPPEMIGHLPKGGAQLDYLGHALVTLILTEIDPLWSLDPVCDERGIPIVEEHGSESWLWGTLTVHGHSRMGVGIAATKSFDLAKILLSDLLKNAAMRHGIGTMLWSKEEFVAPPPPPEPVAGPEMVGTIKAAVALLEPEQREAFKAWWKSQQLPALTSGQLTDAQAHAVLDHLESSAYGPGVAVDASGGVEPADGDRGPLVGHEGPAGSIGQPAGPPTAAAREALRKVASK